MGSPKLFINLGPKPLGQALERERPQIVSNFAQARRPATLLLQPAVSHFSFLQDPEQSNSDILHFLQHAKVPQ